MTTFLVATPKEFSFMQCLPYLKRSPYELLHVCGDDHVIKLIKVNNRPVLFRVMEKDNNYLLVDLLNVAGDNLIREAITSYLSDWFDLKTDLGNFYTLAGKDKILCPLVERFYGYRIVGLPDLFESLTWAVIGQQINLRFAYQMKRKFIEAFGEKVIFNDQVFYLFPTFESVRLLTQDDLMPLQFSRQKSLYVLTIAETFADGTISREKISTLSFQEAKEELMKIKGVGGWTANYVLMKTFHYPNAFPVEDAGLRQAVRNQLKLDRKPTLQDIEKLFKRFKGWEAYATLYLWRSLCFFMSLSVMTF